MRIAATGFAAAFISACSWSDVLIAEIKSTPAASSFGYKEGYESGCKSAIARSGSFGFDRPDPVRDEARMRTESDYKKGWEEGSDNCTTRYTGLNPPYVPPAQ